MTIGYALAAMAIGVIFALTLQARAQHSGPPGNSPEEECARVCHVNHCDDYVKCIGTADPTLCRLGVNEKEHDCLKKCDTPRG